MVTSFFPNLSHHLNLLKKGNFYKRYAQYLQAFSRKVCMKIEQDLLTKWQEFNLTVNSWSNYIWLSFKNFL